MTVAGDYLGRARSCLLQSGQTFEQGDWALSIARAAEVVEFSLKAAIRATGGSHERKHDVSDDLVRQDNYQRFPVWFQQKIARFALVSRILSQLYLRARYGDERLDAPPSGLFSQIEAEAYLRNAEEVFESCDRLFTELARP